jgi:lambda family phage portal protein
MAQILDQFGKPYQLETAYKGGDINRLNKSWLPPHRSGDGAIAESWDLLLARVRDQLRNEPTLQSVQRELMKGVIGGFGIQCFSEAVDDEGEPLDDFNEEADDQFEEWASGECDAEGKKAWAGMQKLAFEEMAGIGESLLLRVDDNSPGRIVPLCYQLLEAEQIDEWRDHEPNKSGSRKRCVRGIEIDGNNRPVAYWLYDDNPHDASFGAQASKRVPAEKVIHNFIPTRASQTRGISWMTSIMQTARDVDWYLGNELTAAALGALLTAYIKRQNGGNGSGLIGGASQGQDANNPFKLGRGAIAELGPNDEVGTVESKRPNRDAGPFIKLLLGMQAMGAGLSPLRLTRDYSQSSYTSARGAHLDDQAYFVVLQEWFAHMCVLRVRREFMRQAVALGRLKSVTARLFLRNERRYQRVSLQPPGREQLDPEAETEAAAGRLRAGLSTFQEECAKRGKHWRKVARQRARENAYFERIGVTPDLGHTAAHLSATGQMPDEEKTANDKRETRRQERRKNRDQQGVFNHASLN